MAAPKKPAAPKKLTAKQAAKAKAIAEKLGISGDTYDPALIKIARKQALTRLEDYDMLLAIVDHKPRVKKPKASPPESPKA